MVENRASFDERLASVVPPGQLLDINFAYMISKYVHRAQARMEKSPDGTSLRYFEHPRRVAIILIDLAGIVDPDMICAALLHDTVEDSDELPPAAIERHWGTNVARYVKLLSKTPKEGYLDRLNKYGDWQTILIKSCDRLDNLRSLNPENVSEEFRIRQLSETREHYIPLFRKMLTMVPEEHKSGAQLVVNEIITLTANRV